MVFIQNTYINCWLLNILFFLLPWSGLGYEKAIKFIFCLGRDRGEVFLNNIGSGFNVQLAMYLALKFISFLAQTIYLITYCQGQCIFI